MIPSVTWPAGRSMGSDDETAKPKGPPAAAGRRWSSLGWLGAARGLSIQVKWGSKGTTGSMAEWWRRSSGRVVETRRCAALGGRPNQEALQYRGWSLTTRSANTLMIMT